MDAEGNLYVLDAGRHVVSVFAAEGGLVRTYGRQGGGPGEFGFPAYLAVAPTGASAVYDFDRRGLVLFDAAGGHEGFFPLDVPQEGTIAFVGDGTIGAAVAHPTPAADSTDVRLLLLGRDTAALSNVRRVDRFEAQQFRCPIPARPSLFLPRVLWDAAHGRVILSDEAGYSVRAYDDGRLTGIWRRDVPVIEATLDLAAWEVAEGDSLRAFGCTVPADEAATRLGYAEIVPVVRRLTVAPDGGLWILRTTETPGEHVVDVFDPTGAYGGTLPPGSPFPTDFRALDEIVTVERDELDVPHVRIYRIVRPS